MRIGDTIIHQNSGTYMVVTNIIGDEVTVRVNDDVYRERIVTRKLRTLQEGIDNGKLEHYRTVEQPKFSMSPIPFVREKQMKRINSEFGDDRPQLPW